MRNKLLLISLISLTIFSCEKEDTNLSGLIGKWNWVSSTGGIAGITYTPKSIGYTKTIEFTGDSIFRLYRNDTLIVESKYQLIRYKSIYNQDSALLINYGNGFMRQSYINNYPDTLFLRDECFDCFIHRYIRIKKNTHPIPIEEN